MTPDMLAAALPGTLTPTRVQRRRNFFPVWEVFLEDVFLDDSPRARQGAKSSLQSQSPVKTPAISEHTTPHHERAPQPRYLGEVVATVGNINVPRPLVL